jgi:hypothetical protein
MSWVSGLGETPEAAFSFPGKVGWGNRGRMSINFAAGQEEPVDLAGIAQELLQDVAEEIARLIHRVKQGEFDALKPLPGTLKSLRDVLLMVIEERGRVEKLRKQVSGTVGNRELDFQSARDEIGSRLARLRDAGAG